MRNARISWRSCGSPGQRGESCATIHTDVSSVSTRPRAVSNTSARSITRIQPTRSHRATPVSDESDHTPNRSRTQSNASSTGKTKEKRSMLPSFGSLGKKAALTSIPGIRKGSGAKDKYGNISIDEGKEALHSDYEGFLAGGTDGNGSLRSESRESLVIETDRRPPSIRRVHTTPMRETRVVKALYDFAGDGVDELPLRVGQLIEVKKEVSNDWYFGECNDRSGLFPSGYCENHNPIPIIDPIPPLPRRSVPPPRTVPTSPLSDFASESGRLRSASESGRFHGFSDAENYATASLSALAQPAASRAPVRKPAPPPPPSRRSASFNNVPSLSIASPPPSRSPSTRPSLNTAIHQFHLDSSPEGSPFAGSDED